MAVIAIAVSALLTVCAGSSLLANNAQRNNLQSALPGRELVVLVDVNPHQEKVLAVELDLAAGVIQKLGQTGNAFSVITFGDDSPAVIKSRVDADEALAAINAVRLGRSSAGSLSAQLYDALNLAFDRFTDDGRPKSVLVITEGNDYPRGNALRQTVSRAQRSHVICNVAMVADHTFYGPKAIQRYGSYLRRLARKTHGRYVEVGSGSERVSASVDRFFR